MSPDPTQMTDKELWQSLATARPVAPVAVSDMEFAAWLEGRLSEAQAARIEAALAADPELRRSALDLADLLGKPLPAAPTRVTVRAQALVGFEVERRTGARSWLGTLLPQRLVSGLQRGVMASLAVVLAIAGFMIGGGLGESYAQERLGQKAAQSDTLAELRSLFSDGL